MLKCVGILTSSIISYVVFIYTADSFKCEYLMFMLMHNFKMLRPAVTVHIINL